MELQANELRIGNYIDLDGVLCIVREIHSGGVIVFIPETDEEIWIDLFQFTGLSLNEEWLLKLGLINEYGVFCLPDEDVFGFNPVTDGFELITYNNEDTTNTECI